MGELLVPLTLGLALGFLVGLQREWATREVAGIRTFPLITLLGVMTASLADRYGGWIFGAGLVGLAAVIVVGNLARIDSERSPDPGITTEVTALLMFGVGGALVAGFVAEGVVVGGIAAVLLHWKDPLHDFTERLDRSELTAVIRLALLGLVILPALPDRAFGPFEVLNPFRIWLMVVLIVGISLAGYVASRLLGARVGTVLAGILGGIISSTATTVSYARRTAENPEETPAAAVVVVLASSVVFLRVLLEVAVVAPEILPVVGPPLAAMMACMLVISAGLYLWSPGPVRREGPLRGGEPLGPHGRGRDHPLLRGARPLRGPHGTAGLAPDPRGHPGQPRVQRGRRRAPRGTGAPDADRRGVRSLGPRRDVDPRVLARGVEGFARENGACRERDGRRVDGGRSRSDPWNSGSSKRAIPSPHSSSDSVRSPIPLPGHPASSTRG